MKVQKILTTDPQLETLNVYQTNETVKEDNRRTVLKKMNL